MTMPLTPELEPKDVNETDLYPIVNASLRQRYDRIAACWNTDAYEGTRRDDLIEELVRVGQVEDHQTILEAMCGTGILARSIRQRFPRVQMYVLDFSRGMLNMIPEGMVKVQASVIAMPFPDQVFHRVFLRSGIYDLPKRLQLKALYEMKRILTEKGMLILQTYYTTPTTKEALNNIVNIKDLASGQYEDMGREYPRYFALREELEAWLEEAGFAVETIRTFEGAIRYLKTKEMMELGKDLWVEYMNDLPQQTKEEIKLRSEPDGSLTYNFPGIIYRLTPSSL